MCAKTRNKKQETKRVLSESCSDTQMPVNGMVRRRDCRLVSAKRRRLKSRFKEYPGFAGGSKDGKRSIQHFRNLISEMVFRDRPVYRGESERMSIMARSL